MKNKTDSTPKNTYNEKGKAGFKYGNPGRPKGSLSMVTLLKNKLDEVPEGQKLTYAEAIIMKWLQLCIRGDFSAIKGLVAYIDGLPTERVQHYGLGELIGNLKDKYELDELPKTNRK